MKFKDLTGKKFGRLTVLSLNTRCKHSTWNCVCDCGKHKIVCGCHLTSGKIISCGCASIERISILNKKHGETKTRLYRIWAGMKSRCYDKNCCSYKHYGDRNISVCDEWRNDFVCFKNWALKNGYADNLTIDRIDNNGNYCPENCRWADNKTQSNNTRRTIILEYKNSKYSIKQLATFLNINYKKFHYGIRKLNYDVETAIQYAKKYKKEKNYEF